MIVYNMDVKSSPEHDSKMTDQFLHALVIIIRAADQLLCTDDQILTQNVLNDCGREFSVWTLQKNVLRQTCHGKSSR